MYNIILQFLKGLTFPAPKWPFLQANSQIWADQLHVTALKVKGHLWMGTDPSGPSSMSVASVLPFVPILATSYIVPTSPTNPVTS